MALDGAGIKELKQQVSIARKMPLNFGLALGKKAEDTALVMHRKKEGSILFKQARKADGVEMAKSTFGTVTIDGNNMTFACASEPPAGMKKKCKAFLKSAKLSLKISILSPDGTEFEKGDDEDEDLVQGEGLDQGENLDQGEDPDTNEEPETQPDPGKRKAAKVALVARIKAANAELLQLSQKDKDRLAPALKTVLGMVSDDALEKALAGLGKIEAAIAAAGGSGGGKKPGGDPDPDDGPTGPGNDDAERERWLKGAARLKPLVAAAVKLPGGDPGALRAAWAWANEKANALVPDYRAAAGSLPEITRLVQLANQEATPAPEVAQQKIREQEDRKQALLASMWADKRKNAEPKILAGLSHNTKERSRIEALWAAANAKANEEQEYEVAIRAVSAALKLIEEMDNIPDQGVQKKDGAVNKSVWERASPALKGPVEELIRAQITDTSALAAAWELANAKAREEDWDAAVAALRDTKRLLDEANANKPEGPYSNDTVEDAGLMVELSNAEHLLENGIKELRKLAADFGNNAPADWATETNRIAGTLDLSSDDGLDAIKAAVATAKTDIAALKKTIHELMAEKEAWEREWDLYTIQRDNIDSHSAAKGEPVLTAFNTFKSDAEAAKAKADAASYPEARTDLKAVTDTYDTLLKLADDTATYQTIRDKRAATIGALSPYANDQSNALKDAAQRCLMNAAPLSNRKRFSDALAELNKIPALLDQAKRADAAHKRYQDIYVGYYKVEIAKLEAEDDKYKAHLLPELTPCRTFAASAEAQADAPQPDFIAAYVQANEIRYSVAAGQRILPLAKAYVDKREAFDPEFTAIEGHDGRAGIEDFYLRAKADKDRLDQFKDAREFAAAIKLMDAIQPMFTPQKALAAKYKIYIDKKKTITEALDKIRETNDDAGGIAASEIAAADSYLSQATAFELIKKFDEATTAIEAAKTRGEQAKALLDGNKKITDAKPEAAGEGDDAKAAQINAWINAIPGLKSDVKGKDDGTFADLIDSVDALLATAKDAMKVNPPPSDTEEAEKPDTATAEAKLQEIDGILKDALQKVERKPKYDAEFGKLKTAVEQTLPGKNVDPDKVITDDLKDLEKQLKAAEDAAKTPGFKFDDALQTIAGALVTCEKVERKADARIAQQTDRTVISDLVAHLNAQTDNAIFKKERDRLNQVIKDADDCLKRFDIAGSDKLIEKGKNLKAPYEKLCTDYTAALASKNTTYAAAKTTVEDNQPILKMELDRQAAMKKQIDKMFRDHAFVAAQKQLEEMGWYTYHGDELLKRYTTYKTARKSDVTDDLGTPTRPNPGLDELIAEIDDGLVKGDELAQNRQFETATALMKALKPKVAELNRQIPLNETFKLAKAAARAKLDEAKEPPERAVVIKPLLDRAEVKFKSAEDLRVRGDFAAATALMNEIPKNCTDAMATGDLHSGLAVLEGVGDAPHQTELEAAIQEVRDKLTQLRTSPTQEQLVDRIIAAGKTLDEAQTAIDGGNNDVQDLIKQACADCGAAEIHQLQVAQVRDETTKAVKLVDDFLGGSHAAKDFMIERMTLIKTQMNEAPAMMLASGEAAAMSHLLNAISTFRKAEALADQRAEYDKERAKLVPESGDPVLKQLQDNAHRYAINDDMKALQSKLSEAASHAEAADPDLAKAIAALKSAAEAAARARLTIKMLENTTAPTDDEVKAILDQPGGPDKLDEIIKKLDPDARRDILRVAMKIRFGCKLEIKVDGALEVDGANKGPNVLKFYEAMSKLPKKHTLSNDSLLGIDDYRKADGSADGGASAYEAWSKKTLSMREGAAVTSSGRGLGSEHNTGSWDTNDDGYENRGDYEPANDEPVQMFNWNTLHEVGHSVDDKYGYMRSKQGDAKFGGWTEYGRDVRSVAEKVAAHFKFGDLAYVQEVLSGNTNPPLADPPDRIKPEEWERRRQQIHNWAENAKSTNNPWETNATAMALELGGGEIIHEAYAGLWVGYKAATRKMGLTGYQFRAPGEWFSEIYAAYYSNKLKPGHPMCAELAALADRDN